MDYAIFARTSIMRYRSVIIFLPKILSSRRRKMVTYHNGAPTTAGFEGIHGPPVLHWHQKEKKKNWIARFSAGRAFFSPTTPFRCVIRNLLFFVCVFLTGGGAEKIGRFCSYEYVCVSIYMCVFWRDVEVNGF